MAVTTAHLKGDMSEERPGDRNITVGPHFRVLWRARGDPEDPPSWTPGGDPQRRESQGENPWPVGHDDGGQGPALGVPRGDHRRGDPQGTLSSWSLLGVLPFGVPMGPAAAIFFHNL